MTEDADLAPPLQLSLLASSKELRCRAAGYAQPATERERTKVHGRQWSQGYETPFDMTRRIPLVCASLVRAVCVSVSQLYSGQGVSLYHNTIVNSGDE